MRLRSLALLLALLPGLMAPVGMTWCTALCTALSAAAAPQPAAAKSGHSCCDGERAPTRTPSGPQLKAGCGACAIGSAPKSDLSKLEVAACAVMLAAPSAAPNLQPSSDAPPLRVRLAFLPPATAGPGGAPLPLRI